MSVAELGHIDSGCPPQACVQDHFQLLDLFVNVLHEFDDEIDNSVPHHLLEVSVCDQETDVVTLDRLPAEYDEELCPMREETRKLPD
eukprot:CAMPEP_0117502294 /NCGR_PEP_ID=MMETSP0784-20121206/23739_1 /TAXON_ID=39447 /ORGANISM="" /LENGTH=86 /DNA_ID=CAMNT_0005297573 /DNA_START=46 /DNA_END=307 /DNA_ORIENTATION=+